MLPDGTYHSNAWCNVILGSCSTDMGTPNVVNPEYSVSEMYDDGHWWDDCASGYVVDTNSNVLLNVTAINWTADELSQAAPYDDTSAWIDMSASVVVIETEGGNDEDDDDQGPSSSDKSDDDDVRLALIIGGVACAVLVGSLIGYAALSYLRKPSTALGGGKKSLELR